MAGDHALREETPGRATQGMEKNLVRNRGRTFVWYVLELTDKVKTDRDDGS